MADIDWGLVEEGLEHLNDKLGTRYDFNKMKPLIESGELIYFKYPTEDYFVLMSPVYPYAGGAYLFVHVAYSRNNNPSITYEMTTAILAYAQENGFNGMQFDSPRPGWVKVFPGAKRRIIHEIEV